MKYSNLFARAKVLHFGGVVVNLGGLWWNKVN